MVCANFPHGLTWAPTQTMRQTFHILASPFFDNVMWTNCFHLLGCKILLQICVHTAAKIWIASSPTTRAMLEFHQHLVLSYLPALSKLYAPHILSLLVLAHIIFLRRLPSYCLLSHLYRVSEKSFNLSFTCISFVRSFPVLLLKTSILDLSFPVISLIF